MSGRPDHGGGDPLRVLHDEIDRRAGELATLHADRLRCGRGCHDCCVDGLTVFEIEADRIRREYPELLSDGHPHPPGRCAFLDDDGACRIYGARPYVCRTQGLPLRWTEDAADGGIVEYRDICPLNEDGPPIDRLPEGACWTLGPTEGRLAALDRDSSGGKPRRVALRDLFDRT